MKTLQKLETKDQQKTIVTRTNELPVLVNNVLTIGVDRTAVLTSQNLAATDIDSDESLLRFNVMDIQHGQFSFASNPTTPINIFYQQNVTDRQVQFKHDGSFVVPMYQVSVSDGILSTVLEFADIMLIQPVNFLATIELSSLDGTNGFVLNGVAAGDYSGFSVSAAGDNNGDGVDDLIIGAPNADPAGRTRAGASYVVFGAEFVGASGVIELSSLNGINGFVLNGVASDDLSGHSVSTAGDINNDGIDDLIIGGYRADPEGRSDAGASYVVFGGAAVGATGVIELSSLNGANGFVLNGVAAGDVSGWTVSAAGDVNNDGIDDLIIGATWADPAGRTNAGASYVVFGGAAVGATGVIELASLNGSNGFVLNGVAAGDFSGISVSAAGDINDDGIDDLIIGANYAAPAGRTNAGASYVVFGGAAVGSTGVIELSSLNGANGFVLNGVTAGDVSGWTVSAAGDVNNDGIDDLIIGANSADPAARSWVGASYVVFGGAAVGATGVIELSSLNGANGFVLNSVTASDASDWAVSAAGDTNNDGIDDLIIGIYPGDPAVTGAGYVIFGKANIGSTGVLELSSLNGTNGVVLNGVAGGSWSAHSVSAAGDVNEDDIDDLIIGAGSAAPAGRTNAGASYVIFGDAGATILRNVLSLGAGQTVELSPNMFNATHVRYESEDLTFIIKNLEHGQFQYVTGETAITFTQAEINEGKIQFMHDGSDFPPSFELYNSDGFVTVGPFTSQVFFATNTHQQIIYVKRYPYQFADNPIQIVNPVDFINIELTLSDNIAGALWANVPTDCAINQTFHTLPTAIWAASGVTDSMNCALKDLVYTPSGNYHNDFQISVNIYNSMDLKIEDTITATGLASIDPPEVAHPIGTKEVEVGQFFSFLLNNTFIDPDGYKLYYEMQQSDSSVLPHWMIFDPVRITLNGTAIEAGITNLLMIVRDNFKNTAFDSFSIAATAPYNWINTFIGIGLSSAFTIGLCFAKRWYTKKYRIKHDLSPDFTYGEIGDVGAERIQFEQYVLRPFAKIIREKLKIADADDFETDKGKIYLRTIAILLSRLKEAGHDIKTMLAEEQKKLTYQVMVAIKDNVRAVSCGERLRYVSFFSSNVITTEKITKTLDVIVAAILAAMAAEAASVRVDAEDVGAEEVSNAAAAAEGQSHRLSNVLGEHEEEPTETTPLMVNR